MHKTIHLQSLEHSQTHSQEYHQSVHKNGHKRGEEGSRPWKGAARTQRRLQTLSPHTPKAIGCDVCGAPQRATKATSCDYVQPAEYVTDPPALAAE